MTDGIGPRKTRRDAKRAGGLRGVRVLSVEPFHWFRPLCERTFRFNQGKDEDGGLGRFFDRQGGILGSGCPSLRCRVSILIPAAPSPTAMIDLRRMALGRARSQFLHDPVRGTAVSVGAPLAEAS